MIMIECKNKLIEQLLIEELKRRSGVQIVPNEQLTEAKTSRVDLTVATKTMGQLGEIIILEGPLVSELAKMLGLGEDWKLKKASADAAYDGQRLSFFENKKDFQPED